MLPDYPPGLLAVPGAWDADSPFPVVHILFTSLLMLWTIIDHGFKLSFKELILYICT